MSSPALYNEELDFLVAVLKILLTLVAAMAPLATSLAVGGYLTQGLALARPARFAVGATVTSIPFSLAFSTSGRGRRLYLLALFGLGIWRVFWKGDTKDDNEPKPWGRTGPLFLAPFLILYLINALAPEIQADGYTYHLRLAREWAERGLWSQSGFYEVLPQGLGVFYAGAAIFYVSSAKVMHLAILVATVTLIPAATQRLGFEGRPAALIYYASPVVGICASSAYDDAALAFFTLAAFYLILEWEASKETRLLPWIGLVAGFCYAVKLPGIVTTLAVILWMAARSGLRGGATVAGAASLMVLPWMARAAFLSGGNPLAPLFNDWFPNPEFHISTQQALTQFLRTYDVAWYALPLEATMRGAKTAGFAGPIFLLTPLALWALRRREGRVLWLAALVAAVPWFFNAGTRFLIPSLMFLSMALVMTVGTRAAWAMMAIHWAISMPFVAGAYAPEGAWMLRGFPWAAALRQEPEADYLRRTLWEYGIAEIVNKHVKPAQKTLDLVAAPIAYIQSSALSPWQHAAADRASDALRVASARGKDKFGWYESRWPAAAVSAVRVETTDSSAGPWSIQEIELLENGHPVFPSQAWQLEAQPNPWEASLAFDRNPVSRWQTWQPREPGMHYQVGFREPRKLDGIRLVRWLPDRIASMRVSVHDARGAWRVVAEKMEGRFDTALDYRKRATAYIRREGFEFILAPANDQGWGPIGRDLTDNPGDWNAERLDKYGHVHLLRLKP